MVIRTITLLTLVVLSLGVAEARMYRWVDENGTTVYSQSPPPSGEASEVKIHTSTAPPAKTASPKAPSTSNTASQDNAKPKAPGPSKQEIAESNRIKTKNCAAAKSNLDIYQNLGRKLLKTPEGLYKRLTEEQRQQKIEETKQLIKEFCDK